jgi:hypothetical protein
MFGLNARREKELLDGIVTKDSVDKSERERINKLAPVSEHRD